MSQKLRMGIVGGGAGSIMGPVHFHAAERNDSIEITAGCFSSNRNYSLRHGKSTGLPPDRIYPTYRDMIRKEAKLDKGERIDFVSILTPNNMHYPIAMAALDAGFHVLTEKPMTVSMEEALNLSRKIEQTEQFFCVAYPYIGYPMVRRARDIVAAGEIGKIMKVMVEYPLGWLATRLEATGHKQAGWRTDPRKVGQAGCLGDVGTHCEHLMEYITGLRLEAISADLTTFLKGRSLDDDVSMLLRFSNGARGIMWASQVSLGQGERHALAIRVFGDAGSLEWRMSAPGTLTVHRLSRQADKQETVQEGSAPSSPADEQEEWLQAYTNLYAAFAEKISARKTGGMENGNLPVPGIGEGLRSLRFIDAVLKSSTSSQKWTVL